MADDFTFFARLKDFYETFDDIIYREEEDDYDDWDIRIHINNLYII